MSGPVPFTGPRSPMRPTGGTVTRWPSRRTSPNGVKDATTDVEQINRW